MLEGNFRGIGHELGRDGLSDAQMEALEWLVNNLIESLNLTTII